MKKILIIAGLLIVVGLYFGLGGGEDLKKAATLKSMEVVGNIAVRNMPEDVAGGFHNIPVEVKELAPGIFQATGLMGSVHTETDCLMSNFRCSPLQLVTNEVLRQ